MHNFNDIKWFKPHEFNEPEKMARGLLLAIDDVRELAAQPMTVSHARQFRPGDPGEHGEGLGVDVRCHFSRDRYRLVLAALGVNPYTHIPIINRIGIYDKHIHLGVSESRAQNVIWWGKSQ